MIRRVQVCILLLITGGFATAQNQYVSTVNYRNLAVSPIAFVPGVSWVVEDNSAYDANHQRFFFQGNANRQPPWYLYTVDVTTGAVLSNPLVPSNNPGQVAGLQYDNSVDTLYATYIDETGNVFFSWVEIATGIVHPKQIIAGYSAYGGSTFDTKDHWYIASNGIRLVTIDARTGYVVYSVSCNASNLLYDNVNSLLFGFNMPPNSPTMFDSVSVSSGALHPICTFPVNSYPAFNDDMIDEAGGSFNFVCSVPSASSCVHYKLYTISLSLGRVVDSALYPYVEDPSNPLDSNLLEFSFDQRRAQLYALNWRPTPQTVAPIFNISASANPACAGQMEVFDAVFSSSAFTANSYQWQVNGKPAGASSPSFTDSLPNNGDSIRCITTLSTSCSGFFTDTSAAIVLTVQPTPASSLSITSSGNNICSGDTVVFQADPVNGGSAPQYQWLVNGAPTGPSGPTFSTGTLSDNDTVRCVMTGNLVCSIPDTSAPEIMLVQPSPQLIMPPDTVIARGQSVQLTPQVQGNVTGFQWQPSTGLNNTSIADPVAEPANTTTYTLGLSSTNGCSTSGKVTIKVYTRLAMPGAFTPNRDGHNDVFRIPTSVSVQLINFTVYNRWGQRVFMTADPSQGWDGTMDGKQAPAGPYVWVVEYVNGFTGERQTAHGVVVLVR